MAKLWLIEYYVESKFKHPIAFPLDMLRYDHSEPYSLNEWEYIINSHVNSIIPNRILQESKSIRLVHYSHGNKNWNPTIKRWESFGYKVVTIKPARES